MSPHASFLALASYLMLPTSWTMARTGMTEASFLAAVLASMFTLVLAAERKPSGSRLPWVAVGLFASIAIMLRYQGLFLLPPLLVAGYLLLAKESVVTEATALSIALGPPFGCFVAMALRNALVSPAITGGQSEFNSTPLMMDGAVRQLGWTLEGLLRSQVPFFADGSIRPLFMVPIGVLAIGAVRTFSRFRRDLETGKPAAATIVSVLAIAFSATVVIVHVYLAVSSSAMFVSEPRYFEVLIPSAILVIFIALQPERTPFPGPKAGRMKAFAAIAVIAAIAAGNGLQHRNAKDAYWHTENVRLARRVLLAKTHAGADTRVIDQVGRLLNKGEALLTSFPNEVFLVSGIPTVGLTTANYLGQDWTEIRVRSLVSEMRVGAVLVIGSELTLPRARNQSFMQHLNRYGTSSWLIPVVQNQDAKLFRVVGNEDSAAD
jgi:hypothetical protein